MGKNSLIKWAAKHKGGLKAIPRRNGIAYLYRYSYNRQNFSINFPAGTPPDYIRLKILETETNLLKQRLGLDFVKPLPTPPAQTLLTLLNWYNEISIHEQLAAITIRRRRHELERFVNFIGAQTPLANLTREHLNLYKRHLLKTNNNGAYWSLQKLQTIFRKALYENIITTNPFIGFQQPRLSKLRNYLLLTPQEMFTISKTFTSEQARLAWNISRFTGLRGSDLVALTTTNFDFDRGLIRYHCHKMNRFEGAVIHPNLYPYLETLKGRTGAILNYSNSDALGLVFRKKIHAFKGPNLQAFQIGCHTPRRSLGAYIRNVAKWPKENIKIFLGHHAYDDDTDLYTFETIETIRDVVNALPFI